VTSTPATSQPAGRKVHVNTGSFLYTGPKSFATGSLIFLSENMHPQQILTGSPLSSWDIGLQKFVNLVVKRWSLKSLKPKIVNAGLSFFLSGFYLSQFRQSQCRETCLLDSRIPICRNSNTLASIDFQHHFTSSGLWTSQYRES
jgi:hypothetical protein